MMSPIDKFILGFVSPFKGLRLIFSSKKKFMLSIFPFLFGIVIFAGGFFWAFNYMGGAVDGWLRQFEIMSGALFTVASFFMALFSWVAFFTVAFLASYVVMSIFGGPFYSMLAEDVFKTNSISGPKGGTFRLIFTMLFLSIIKISIFVMVGLACFIMSFIPILNIFSTYLIFLVVAFDCSDYSFEIDYLSLRQRFSFIFKHFWEYSGMTLSIMCTSLIPGSFFLLLPAFICGATEMYIQLENK